MVDGNDVGHEDVEGLGVFGWGDRYGRHVCFLLGELTGEWSMSGQVAVVRPSRLRRVGAAVVFGLVVAACTSGGPSGFGPVDSPSSTVPADPGATTVVDPVATTVAGPITTTVADPAVSIPPITGYGDFSSSSYLEFDEVMVMELIAQCITDQGFPMTFDPIEGNKLAGEVPPEQSARLRAVLVACSDGIQLPDRPMTEEELADYYEFFLASAECLRGAGYDIPPAPSFDRWAETYTAAVDDPLTYTYWQPVDYLPDLAIGRGIEAFGCPLRYRVGWRTMIPPAG